MKIFSSIFKTNATVKIWCDVAAEQARDRRRSSTSSTGSDNSNNNGANSDRGPSTNSSLSTSMDTTHVGNSSGGAGSAEPVEDTRIDVLTEQLKASKLATDQANKEKAAASVQANKEKAVTLQEHNKAIADLEQRVADVDSKIL
jgi:hypothetical protein